MDLVTNRQPLGVIWQSEARTSAGADRRLPWEPELHPSFLLWYEDEKGNFITTKLDGGEELSRAANTV